MSDFEFEMKISKTAMEIARKIADGKLSETEAIEKIAKDFNIDFCLVEDRIKDLLHPNLIQTIKELV